MFISGDKSFISFAEGAIVVVAIAVFASLTVLPAMLSWLGDRVEKGRIPLLGRRRRPAGKSRFWTAVTGRVMRHPVVSILLAGGLLVALAIPALQMKIVTSGVEQLPQSIPIIVTYDKVKAVFPTEGVVATVVVEADDVRSGAVAAGISDLRNQVKDSKAFLPGTEVIYSKDGTVAQINVPTPGSGNDAPSTHALGVLRDQIIPATVGRVPGASVNVTGEAASSEDFASQLTSRLPLIFAFVFGLAFLLMLVTFRSIVIPIKAILLNLLSVGAAYGVLVIVFQNGNGESLLGFTSNGGVTNWLPLFLFVVLFGLSMDYHVFILSRVRELYDRGMSTDEAVRQGISTTAGTVTSAAAVMVGVFAVFITLTFLDFKEMGLGLAVAVLIDATIIRGVLLPASMTLLGDWNWYLPRWLEWLPRIGAERDAAPAIEPTDPEAPEEPEPADAPRPTPVPA
jgi:RND superfamily putative drug exporter